MQIYLYRHILTFLLERYSIPLATCHDQHTKSIVVSGKDTPGTLPESPGQMFPCESKENSPVGINKI